MLSGWKKPEFEWKEYLMDLEAEVVPEKTFNLV